MTVRQKSILFLPFLSIPSGHHQVANAIMNGVQEHNPDWQCEKIDILSYSYGKIESLVSSTYLKWIHSFPEVYSWLYQKAVYKDVVEEKRYRLYELLFLSFMRKLLERKQPDLIICTHALPSYMVNFLKVQEGLSTKVVNIYTDYFVHRFWGISHIDYHFVATEQMRNILLEKGVEEGRIQVTGIPIHQKIVKKITRKVDCSESPNVLLTGGNLGVGELEQIVRTISDHTSITYYVLCGKNEALFQWLKRINDEKIIPLPYIESREEMNLLYDQMDAIITKPGGVTISECLFKHIPIFIYHALPGQEEINLRHLSNQGVVFDITNDFKNGTFEERLCSFFADAQLKEAYFQRVMDFRGKLDEKEPVSIVKELLG